MPKFIIHKIGPTCTILHLWATFKFIRSTNNVCGSDKLHFGMRSEIVSRVIDYIETVIGLLLFSHVHVDVCMHTWTTVHCVCSFVYSSIRQ